jgi:serine/threonine-protein kinase
MASSMVLGTLLRQRYLIQQVLGQGGFGRTYLAVDQERFNELCVIKEFNVPYQDDSLVEKAKTLFQREATTLYQIQHPQIPRFWAAFESEHRLFLVQDFVQGQTYRNVLQSRKKEGQGFSDSEIIHLLNHLLPVLSYLHDRDIIHRDISPENIILRSTDPRDLVIPAEPGQISNTGLPVLIDFGAVKEAASHWPIVSTITRVGKIGYAPPEQLQTGNVSPHSDIYALGATCLVLLTGREPQNLLNSQTLAWQWQPYVQIRDPLALVLQKMVALHPSDRYQTAREVWADLQPLVEGSLSSTLLNPMVVSPPPVTEPDIAPAARDSVKQNTVPVKTQLFMANHSDPRSSETFPETNSAQSSILRRRKFTSNIPSNLAVPIGIAASLLVATGIGAHLFQATTPLASNHQLNTRPVSMNSGSSRISNGQPEKIEFAPGEISAVKQGNLQDQNKQPYLLEAAQGQIMTVTLSGTGVQMNVLRASGQPIGNSALQTRIWTGELPATEQYKIEVTGSGAYSLDVAITPISRLDDSDTQRVRFARGKNSTTVTGEIRPHGVRRYLLKANARQIMGLRLLQGNATLRVLAPNGQPVDPIAADPRDWKGRLPRNGEYTIELSASKQEDFALVLEIH